MRYALPQHVFVCRSHEHIVFLNLKQDRYLALDAVTAGGLATLVQGWPSPAIDNEAQCVATAKDPEIVAQFLMKRGLLTADGTVGKDATPVSIEPPTSERVPDDLGSNPSISAGILGHFLSATLLAAIQFRFRPLEHVVQRVRRRNEATRRKQAPVDLSRVESLIAAFARLRPFLFTSKNACLFESFALLEFLSRYGIYPSWVFGVQTRPFAAHCWLQLDGVVLNDTIEHVSGYTPIMVV